MNDSKTVSRRGRVFLGSSEEAREHVDLIAEWLEEEGLTPVPWTEPEVFLPGSPIMKQILDQARNGVTAAAFVFAADDLLADGDTQPRDNVILEYGLFAGALGEANTIAFQVGSLKKPSNLSGIIHIDLSKKYAAKRRLKAWVRKLRENEASGIGKLFETYVDAALCTVGTSLARTEVLQHAHDKTLIPSRYLYDSEVGADNWIALCRDVTYHYFHDGLRFWGDEADSFVQAIKQETGNAFDFISLGPGDGRKDLELIRAWAGDDDLDVIYYPYDTSLRMIGQAVKEIRKGNVPVKLRAVLADFENLSQMKTVFDARDTPNIISLLGNSLGNVDDELNFVRNLASLMEVGDLLLLEVRLHSDNPGISELDRPKAKEFYFSPLEHYLALKLDEKKLKSQVEKTALSKIPGAQSTLIYYDGFKFDGKPYPRTQLLCINAYDPDEFLSSIEKTGFERILSRIDDKESFLACLMKRVKPKKGKNH